MNIRTIFGIAVVICMAALAACSTAAPIGAITANSTAIGPTSSSDPSTLACGTGGASAALTPELTEGPFFKANSPKRASLLDAGMQGTKLVMTGYVYTTDCKPIANALLDFWQADAKGVYDNSGYTLRGHQFTDANGRYQLTTVVPGLYTGRTEHIHVKVQAPNGKLITTQLFFPGVSQNDSDGIFDARLLMATQQTSGGVQAQYNFVVPVQ